MRIVGAIAKTMRDCLLRRLLFWMLSFVLGAVAGIILCMVVFYQKPAKWAVWKFCDMLISAVDQSVDDLCAADIIRDFAVES